MKAFIPTSSGQQGFTLIELMIVVAIIGILAAVSIPAYQNYVAKGQFATAMSEMATYKNKMIEEYTFTGSWPTTAETMTGKYGTVQLLAATAPTTNNGTTTTGTPAIIRYTFTLAAASSKLKGASANTVELTPTVVTSSSSSEVITWACATTVPTEVRPQSCK